MKKLLTIISIILPLFILAQEPDAKAHYKAISIVNGNYNQQAKSYTWKDLEIVNIPVEMNGPAKKLVIYTENVQEYSILDCTENSVTGKAITWKIDAIDKDNNERVVMLFQNPNTNQLKMLLYIYYPHFVVKYELIDNE